MENKLIDPYGLLGVDSRSNLAELKKNYYNMALLCHPDKGGNNKDMNVVSSAYNYIKVQLENVKETTYETLEDEFAIFCKKQEEIKPPTFGHRARRRPALPERPSGPMPMHSRHPYAWVQLAYGARAAG